MTDAIKIRCEGSPAPGASWIIEAEFRPLRRGFSVWLYEYNIMVDVPRWRKVGGSTKPLSWRTAYEYLASDDNIRVFGDFWFEASIDGLPRWSADILKLVFIVDEESPFDYTCIGNLLLGFTDDEIQSIVPPDGFNPFEPEDDTNDDNPTLFRTLSDLACDALTADLVGSSLDTIKIKAHVQPHTSLVDLAAVLHEQAGIIKLEQEQERLSSFIDATSSTEPQNPKNEDAPQPVDAYAHLRKWEEISKGALPNTIEAHIDLIACWLDEPLKPTGGGRQTLRGVNESSEWPILMWLLGSSESETLNVLSHLNALRPDLASRLATEVMQRGKRKAYYFEGPNRFSGWAENVIGKHIHRAHVEFALRFQAAADQLGIPIDDSHRIGDLPYLPVKS